ncbi:MAG: FHA domain-containing protein [Oscillospiraceae bacterium]|nr:FHA domain-containing protein [Oscillospiraceae bacterium]
MQKYKICPSCRSKNEPTLLECLYCEADLTRVKITDEETEKMLEENASTSPASSEKATMIRVCDCGEKNPANARKCQACGEDISDITPTPDEVTESAPVSSHAYVLSSLDGQYAYKVFCDETVIGRENSMSDYLASKSYVSRAHAKLTIEGGLFYIENLSGTNFTYVNNKKIIAKTELKNGDELGLGGTNINGKCQSEAAYFLVRINQCM